MNEEIKMTPMLEQYFAIKQNYQDCLLFYRLGDFYELFFEDAKIASEVLEITLTRRNKKSDNSVLMCGVPHHASSEYIRTLVDKGYKVAICEQLEDAKLTKGMVKRDVVQVITPGTVLEAKNRDEKSNHYLAALIEGEQGALAYVDIATGEMRVSVVPNREALLTELSGLAINELVYETISDALKQQLQSRFAYVFSQQHVNDDVQPFEHLLAHVNGLHRQVLQLLLSYVFKTQKRELIHLQPAEIYAIDHFLKLDYNAKYNLELVETTKAKTKKGSLLWLMDETKTAMGGRLLRSWLDKPLLNASEIERRYDKVDSLLNHYFERIDLVTYLKAIYDLERLVARVSFGNANARDLIQLKQSLEQIPYIVSVLQLMNDQHAWDDMIKQLPEQTDIISLIDRAIVDEPPISMTEGGVVKDGYSEVLDNYRLAMRDGKQWIVALQQKEREKTGIKTLKIGYNRVFGYYIEVTKGQLHLLKEGEYDRKQTLTNAERFTTAELKEQERIILEAEEKSGQLEYELFVGVREFVKERSRQLQQLAKTIASIDVLQSFAQISEQYHYVRPTLVASQDALVIENGRHPVVEKVIGKDKYVPNHLIMNDNRRLMLITGPNMSGKSTFMRQTALCVIMAQMGCFVPADKAELPVFDRIFTRIGAADDLFSGQSTFMVEMVETNQAIRYATDRSLLLFDEIGRGTATYDGMALAEAILRYIHQHVKAKALFSTHYHELTELDKELPELCNVHVGAIEKDGELIFLHHIQDGPADKSYGLHVAQLAGLPKKLLQEAQNVLQRLESVVPQKAVAAEQLSLFEVDTTTQSSGQQEIIDKLKNIDLMNLTPLEVMQEVHRLQQIVNK